MLPSAFVGRLVFRSRRAASLRWPLHKKCFLLKDQWRTAAGKCTYATNVGNGNLRPTFLQPPSTSLNNGDNFQVNAVSSIEEFESLVERGEADVSTARLFLQASMQRLKCLSLEEQRDKAAKVGAGKLLSWFWGHGKEETRNVDLDSTFANALCYHLFAEGKQDFVWDWLRIEAANTPMRGECTKWHGRLLAGLIAARIHWDGSADGAIALFLSAAQEFKQSIHLVVTSLRIRIAIKSLGNEEQPMPCSSSMFDAFVESLKFTLSGPPLLREHAILIMFHPTRADATAALQLYRQQHQNPDMFPGKVRRSVRQAHAYYMARAAHILRLQGRKEDADWVDAHLQRFLSGAIEPSTFIERAYRRAHVDTRLKSLFDSSSHTQDVLEIVERHLPSGSSVDPGRQASPEPAILPKFSNRLFISGEHPRIRNIPSPSPDTSPPTRSVITSPNHSALPILPAGSPWIALDNVPDGQDASTPMEFEHLSADRSASLEAAKKVLQNSRAVIKLSNFSVLEQRSKMAREKVGARMLTWFEDHMDEVAKEQEHKAEFAELLTWHLHGENHDQYVSEWLSSIEHRVKANDWGGHLLAGLVKAKLEWESIDAALEVFHDNTKKFTSDLPGGLALRLLTRALRKPDAAPCQPLLFERHLHREGRQEEKALLSLYHPTTPNCDPLLQCLREEPEDFLRISSHIKGLGNLFLLRAAYILRLQGRLQDSQFVLDIVRSSKYFKPPYDQLLSGLQSDKRLRHLYDKSAYVKEATATFDGLLSTRGRTRESAADEYRLRNAPLAATGG